MENLKSKLINVDRLVKLLAVCMIIFHLILMALGASGQNLYALTAGPTNFLNSDSQKIKVRKIYNSQVGVREKQVNSGPYVEKYLRYVGLPKGNPWFAAFVCWVYGQAGVGNPRSGWSADLFAGSRTIFESGKLRKAESGWAESRCACPPGAGGGLCKMHSVTNKLITPVAGDVFGLYFPEKGKDCPRRIRG